MKKIVTNFPCVPKFLLGDADFAKHSHIAIAIGTCQVRTLIGEQLKVLEDRLKTEILPKAVPATAPVVWQGGPKMVDSWMTPMAPHFGTIP
jgi:hypothetical protein